MSKMESAARLFQVAQYRGGSDGDYRARLGDAWRLVQVWHRATAGVDPAASSVADLAHATMSAFSGMSPADIAILDAQERPCLSQVLTTIARENKAALIARLPDLAAFYVERDRRAQETAKAEQEAVQRRQAAFDAAAPARLLEKLRKQGAVLALEGGKITLQAGTAISEADHDAVREHKTAIVAILRREAEAARPLVIA